MKWGKRRFSVTDMLGDLVMHWWAHRHVTTWEDHARRLVKLAALVLVGLALVQVLYPTQMQGWLLWLGEDKRTLAHWTAVVLVGVTAIILPLVRYAHSHSRSLAIAGGVFAVAMMIVVLMGGWNFYAASSGQKVTAALAATGGARSRIQEAENALSAHETRTAQALATFDQAIAETSAGSPTGRSRLVAQRTEAAKAADEERRSLQAELREARAAEVGVVETVTDPRPIDGYIAGMMGADRGAVAVSLDLFRSLVFELLALLFVSLGTTAALSRMGAPVIARPEEQEPLAIEDLRHEPAVQPSPAWVDTPFEDLREKWSERAKKAAKTRAARKAKGVDPDMEEPGPVSLDDPRIARAASPKPEAAPIDAEVTVIEMGNEVETWDALPAPEPLPSLLDRARSGADLQPHELERLAAEGLIEQVDGQWREVVQPVAERV